MYINNLRSGGIARETLEKSVENLQVENSLLDGISAKNAVWKSVSIKDCNAPGMLCSGTVIESSSFCRSNMQEAAFLGCAISGSEYNGTTLIKASFEKCRIRLLKVVVSTMQRAVLRRCVVENSVFRDFEGIYSTVEDCVFKNCSFELTSGQFMNGFTEAKVRNSIFIGCSFVGYPLRGACVSSCVFAGCSGEISDTDDFTDTVGFGRTKAAEKSMDEKEKAEAFISRWR